MIADTPNPFEREWEREIDPLDAAADLTQDALDAALDHERAVADVLFGVPVPPARDCVECGLHIPAARLQVVPGAVRCQECQCIYEDWLERRGL